MRSLPLLLKISKEKYFLLISFFLSATVFVRAQATFTANPTAAAIATELQSTGVLITNPVITTGNGSQIAIFSNGVAGASFEVDKGVAFTTSSVSEVFTTNDQLGYSSTIGSAYNDLDLRNINTDANQDVVIFEFDFEALPNYTGVLFKYQFGSEEYPDYVGSTFNDVFGFFVSDPSGLDPTVPDGDTNGNGNYGGSETPAVNLALVPGTSNVVAINNINAGFRGCQEDGTAVDLSQFTLFTQNGHYNDTDGDPNNSPATCNDNSLAKPIHVEFNGITKTLTANIDLTPGIVYHMKIAIADVIDDEFDSGVFMSSVGGVPIIIASNDEGVVTSTTGGVAVVNVLVDDSVAGSLNPLPADVELVQVSTEDAGITLNTSTGEVNVAPGVAAGVYELVYNVCNPSTNCGSAVVVVTVLEDTDGDGLADEVDLDDDNDGILDVNEGLCTPVKSGAWTISGTTATFDYGNGVIARLTTTHVGGFYSENFNAETFWSESLSGDVSLSADYSFGSTLTVNFEDSLGGAVEVKNPVIHLDRIGGSDGVNQNSALVTLEGGLNWQKLAGTNDFEVTSNTVTDEGVGTPIGGGYSGQSSLSDDDGSAAGSLRIDATVSTFTLTFVQNGTVGAGADGVELILYACENLDTDLDGIPNYLDTDSDNDGCADAIEGAGAIVDLVLLVDLTGGSIGGSIQNLGATSDAEGNPIVSGSGFEQGTTVEVINNTISTACTTDIKLTKTVDNALPKVGDTIVYLLTVVNNGKLNATDVRVIDVLPPTVLAYVSDNPSQGSYDTGTSVWTIGNIDIGDAKTLEITVTVAQAGIIVNTAEISLTNETDIDSTPNNNG